MTARARSRRHPCSCAASRARARTGVRSPACRSRTPSVAPMRLAPRSKSSPARGSGPRRRRRRSDASSSSGRGRRPAIGPSPTMRPRSGRRARRSGWSSESPATSRSRPSRTSATRVSSWRKAWLACPRCRSADGDAARRARVRYSPSRGGSPPGLGRRRDRATDGARWSLRRRRSPSPGDGRGPRSERGRWSRIAGPRRRPRGSRRRPRRAGGPGPVRGPTVYDWQHIGNLYAYIVADVARRTFEYFGYRVTQVMNITDVGHIVDDADAGEDKMELAAKREQKDPLELAAMYTRQFIIDRHKLNILDPHVIAKATDHIAQMIELIRRLIEKGNAYVASDGVYFDVTTFPGYGTRLNAENPADREAGARVEVNENKRHPADFALWRAAKPGDLQQWESPWGRGNPGWHIECSAMSMQYLGETVDPHSGGE